MKTIKEMILEELASLSEDVKIKPISSFKVRIDDKEFIKVRDNILKRQTGSTDHSKESIEKAIRIHRTDMNKRLSYEVKGMTRIKSSMSKMEEGVLKNIDSELKKIFPGIKYMFVDGLHFFMAKTSRNWGELLAGRINDVGFLLDIAGHQGVWEIRGDIDFGKKSATFSLTPP